MSTALILPVTILSGADMSVNQASAGVHIQYVDNIGVQLIWTGAPVGTFGISVSNNAVLGNNGLVTGGTWTPLVLTSPNPPAPSGTAGNGAINLTQLGFAFLQVTYTATSGTGNCTAILAAKSV